VEKFTHTCPTAQRMSYGYTRSFLTSLICNDSVTMLLREFYMKLLFLSIGLLQQLSSNACLAW